MQSVLDPVEPPRLDSKLKGLIARYIVSLTCVSSKPPQIMFPVSSLILGLLNHMHSPHFFEEQFMLYLSITHHVEPKHDQTVNDSHQVYVRLQDWALTQGFVLVVDLTDWHFTA